MLYPPRDPDPPPPSPAERNRGLWDALRWWAVAMGAAWVLRQTLMT